MPFFQTGPIPENAITGSYYNYSLVALSYLIAILGSYVALDMAGRLRSEPNPKLKKYWLLGGAFAMGAGIWSMHFIGMLAFIMPMPMSYDVFWTTFSMLVAILASGFALFLLRTEKKLRADMVIGGILIGLGIATMHYTGMQGMEGHIKIAYLPGLFFLSIVIAIVASEAALWLGLRSNEGPFKRQFLMKIGSALIMGAAICGMHYTGMAAAVFTPIKGGIHVGHGLPPYGLAFYIAGITTLIIVLALLVSTHKQLLGSAVKREKDFLNAILQNLHDGIAASDTKSGTVLLNLALQKMVGLTKQEISKQKWRERIGFYNPNSKVALLGEEEPLNTVLDGESIHGRELILKTKHGQEFHVMIDGQPIISEDNKIIGAVVAIHDITDHKRMENQLMVQATHDMLTGLPNRLLLIDRIQQAINMARRDQTLLSVLYLDIDRFKLINDTFGHAAGDDLLILVGERLKNCARSSDTVARLGGDEFVVLLSTLENDEGAITIAHKILMEVAKPFTIANHKAHITISIGVSDFPKNGEDPDTLLKNADTAMYRVKAHGRNNVRFFSEDMNERTIKRLELEQYLYEALEKQEFILHYQPIIDLKSGSIVGCEALLRWQHPTLGLLQPAEFLPIAEETGVIVTIGEWVLNTACTQNKQWQNEGLPLIRMSINVSAQQFNELGFLETVRQALEKSQLEPKYVELELTENTILKKPEETLVILEALKKIGVSIALDDFGIGYSSLGYLSRLPVHKLKIDKSFVHNISRRKENAAIVLAIINMASSMKLKVTAEGAETESELTFLRFNRCDEVQGFYFSRPLKVEEMSELLRRNHKFLSEVNGIAPQEEL